MLFVMYQFNTIRGTSVRSQKLEIEYETLDIIQLSVFSFMKIGKSRKNYWKMKDSIHVVMTTLESRWQVK